MLDVACGLGRTIATLASLTGRGEVYEVYGSALGHAVARRARRAHVHAGTAVSVSPAGGFTW